MKEIKNLPLTLFQYGQKDSFFSPPKREVATTLGDTFSDSQIKILEQLIARRDIDPCYLSIDTQHISRKAPSGRGSRFASVTLSCLDEKSELHFLIMKSSNSKPDYKSWKKPEGWVKNKDLQDRKEENGRKT